MLRPPNILWILTTQWRGSALSCAGDPNVKTPHLDAFSAAALNFTQAYTPHPFGPFARAALLTGLPSPENGVCEYFDPLPRSSTTIAHQLNELGYSSAFLGKWHLSARDPAAPLVGEPHARQRVSPEDRGGFSFWEGFESGFLLNDPWLQGTAFPSPRQFQGYQSDILCARCADWIEHASTAAAPWFCLLSLEAPHPPYAASAAGIRPEPPDQLQLCVNVPRGGEEESKARQELAGYYAHIQATDRALGHLLQSPALADAIIVFTSVHGDMHGAHGLFRKGWPYEESLRVPLLVRASPNFHDSASLRAPVSLLDLPRWTQAWARGEAANFSARPFVTASMPSVVKLPLQCDRPWTCIRTATKKLVLNSDGSPWLFFDLEQDPLEMNNLAQDPAQRSEIARLRALPGK